MNPKTSYRSARLPYDTPVRAQTQLRDTATTRPTTSLSQSPGHSRINRAAQYLGRISPPIIDNPTFYAVRGRKLVIFRSR